jgi:hypothetical protein
MMIVADFEKSRAGDPVAGVREIRASRTAPRARECRRNQRQHAASVFSSWPAYCGSPFVSAQNVWFWCSCPVASRLREDMTTTILLIDEDVRLIQ